MLVIRFSRVGKRNHAQFRLIVQEKTASPKGGHVAVVGSYDPHLKRGVFRAEEIKKWLSHGAQASDSVHNLLVKEGIIEGKRRRIKMPVAKKKTVQEIPAEKKEESPEAPAEEKKEEQPTEQPQDVPKGETKADEKKEHIAA